MAETTNKALLKLQYSVTRHLFRLF